MAKTPEYIIRCRPPEQRLQFRIEPQEGVTESVVAACGHQVWRRERLLANGIEVGAPNEARFTTTAPDKCILCELGPILAGVVVCAICGDLIKPGDGVSMQHVQRNPHLSLAAQSQKNELWVGCTSTTCCPVGTLWAGVWNGEHVESLPTTAAWRLAG